MATLQDEFYAFYDEIKFNANSDILEKKEKLKNDFKDNFPKKFKDKYDKNFYIKDIRMIDQGSYKIGTTIDHDLSAYDIDIATILTLDIEEYKSAINIKELAKSSLKSTNREPKIKNPCVSVNYTKKGEEKFHLDFPVYAKTDDDVYISWGKSDSTSEWKPSDPEALNDYFLENLTLDSDDDNINKQRQQKKRIIRYLKWWKAEAYQNSSNDNEIPPSVGLTILVCKNYKIGKILNEYNDLKSLYLTVDKIFNNYFYTEKYNGTETKKIKPWKLPVKPKSDTLFKLNNSQSSIDKLYNRFKKLRDNLEKAYEENNELKAAEILANNIFGEKFPLPEEDSAPVEDTFA